MNSIDRRHHPRFPFHSKGELCLDLIAYRGALVDISIFGALFRSALRNLSVTPDRDCVLDVLNLNDTRAFRISGRIAHATENLIGIQFLHFDQGHEEQLRKICQLNLAPASILNRKLPALFQA